MELIEREKAISAIYGCQDVYINNLPILVDKADAIASIRELPSIEPRKGKMIDMQAAIEVASRECHEFRGIFADIERGLKELSTEEQKEQKEPCRVCESLENGDTLYSMSGWDGGIGFDYIHNIKYCPVCGRKL